MELDLAFDENEDAFVDPFLPIINTYTLEDLSHFNDQFDGDEHYLTSKLPLNRWDDRVITKFHPEQESKTTLSTKHGQFAKFNKKRRTQLERLALADAPGCSGRAR